MTIKVVQFGSGNVGRMAIRAVMARPDMDLVGLVVTNPDKVGRDMGELAGGEPVGAHVLGAELHVILGRTARCRA